MDTDEGRRLRLKQQHFFVSSSLQDMLKSLEKRSIPITEFPKHWTVQLNDTHSAIAVAELMRLLIDQYQIGWDKAWNITTSSVAYTNRTLLPEALEKWDLGLFNDLLPRHLEIIYEINWRFLQQLRLRYPGDDKILQKHSIIDEEGSKSVRMAHLATIGAHHINGVAALHSDLIKRQLLPEFAALWPEKFTNVTNGVTPRRLLDKQKANYENAYSEIKEIFSEKLIKDIIKSKIISFDLWDTVIRRNCNPEEIKLRLSRFIFLKVKADNAQYSPIDFYKFRKTAEDTIANEIWEYKFDEAMKKLIKDLTKMGFNTNTLSVNELIKKELQIEIESTFIDNNIMKLINFIKTFYESKKIIIISDFYHSSSFLKKLLKSKEIEKYFSKIYSSSDYMKTKRDGKIFKVVKDIHSIKYSQWLHIGDNVQSDYEIPKQIGINSFLFVDKLENLRMNSLKIGFLDHLNSRNPFIHQTRIKHLLKNSEKDFKIIFKNDIELDKNIEMLSSGINYSGILIGYILDIIEKALRLEVKKVFFFSREGIFFKELYDLLVNLDVYEIGSNYPSSEVLYVSRAATFAASIKKLNLNSLMRIWNLYSSQSVRGFSKSLNLDTKLVKNLCKKLFIDFDEVLEYPWQNKKFLELYNNKEFFSHTESRIKKQKEDLLNYLATNNLKADIEEDILISDIGWRGTIQDNLSYLLSKKRIHGHYLALDRFLNDQPNNSFKSGFIVNNNIDNNFIIGEYSIYEFLFNALGGTVIGYEKNGEPIKKIVKGEEDQIKKFGSIIQCGIKEGIKISGEYIKNHGLSSRYLITLSRDICIEIQQNPNTHIIDAYNSTNHNELFGMGSSKKLLEITPTKEIADAEPSKRFAILEDCLSKARWEKAFTKSSEIQTYKNNLEMINRISMPNSLHREFFYSLENKSGIICAPAPIAYSGGLRNILNLAKALSAAGANIEIQAEGFNADNWYYEDELANTDVKLVRYWQLDQKADFAVATVGHSAEHVSKRIICKKKNKFYLLQDYEASFNPINDTYINIQNSYNYNLNPLCIGSWLPHVIKNQHGINSGYAGLGIDTDIYKPIPEIERTKRIAFLYQPEKSRRLNFMNLQALKLVKNKFPDIEIVSYGSNQIPDADFEITHKGITKTLSELNEIYCSSLVGLCVSLTNPSRVPFEMMAAGCVPVDVYRYNNLFDYKSNTALLAFQEPESIAEAIITLLSDKRLLNQHSKNCLDFAKNRKLNWETETLVNVISEVVNGNSIDNIRQPTLSYLSDPFISKNMNKKSAKKFCDWQRKLAEIT